MPYIGNIVQDFSVNTAMLNSDSVTSIKIDDGTIVNADINDSAAIAGTKISPDFGSQNIVTTGSLGSYNLTLTSPAPELSFSESNGDPDYKIQSNGGAIKIVDSTNSTDRFVINSSGNTGIGTSSPSAKLHVVESTSIPAVKIKSGTSTNQNASLTFQNDNEGGLLHLGVFGSSATTFGANEATDAFITANNQLSINAQNSSGQIRFGIGSTPNTQMLINSSGQVGIGTTSPSSKLQVRDSTQGCIVRVTAANDSESGIDFGDDDDTDIGRIRYSNSNNSMKFIVNTSERMRITSDGRLGIGTTNPQYHLHQHVDSSDSNYHQFTNSTTGSGSAKGVLLGMNSSEEAIIYNRESTALRFGTDNTERMRIASDGKVGIGTTSANTKLDVRDSSATGISSRSTSTQSTDSNKGLRVRNNSDTDTFSVSYKGQGYFAGSVGIGTTSPQRLFHQHEDSSAANYHVFTNTTTGSGATDGLLVGISADENALIWTYENQPIRFATNNSERMRIGASGDVRIGSVGSGNTRLHITAFGTSNVTGNNALRVNDSAGTHLFIIRDDGLFQTGAGAASPYNLTGSTGANVFIHANSKSLRRSTSSIKYKKDIADATWGLAEVLKLRPVTFKSNGTGELADDQTYGGFTAEDIHDAGLTEFVQYNENNEPDALSYGNMVALLTNAIKELSAKVAALEAA